MPCIRHQQLYLLLCDIPGNPATLFEVPVTAAMCTACLAVVKLMAHWTLVNFTLLSLTATPALVQAVWNCSTRVYQT